VGTSRGTTTKWSRPSRKTDGLPEKVQAGRTRAPVVALPCPPQETHFALGIFQPAGGWMGRAGIRGPEPIGGHASETERNGKPRHSQSRFRPSNVRSAATWPSSDGPRSRRTAPFSRSRRSAPWSTLRRVSIWKRHVLRRRIRGATRPLHRARACSQSSTSVEGAGGDLEPAFAL